MSNLRIKNKRLKRELEILKSQTVPTRILIDNRDVVTLKCKQEYDHNLIGYIPDEVIMKNIEYDIAKSLSPFLRINKYHDYMNYNFVVEAELDFITKEKRL